MSGYMMSARGIIHDAGGSREVRNEIDVEEALIALSASRRQVLSADELAAVCHLILEARARQLAAPGHLNIDSRRVLAVRRLLDRLLGEQ